MRRPLIPGINDDPDELNAFGDFLGSLRPGVQVELLPYHRLGESKFERLGRKYPLSKIEPPTQEDVATAKRIVEKYDIELVTT